MENKLLLVLGNGPSLKDVDFNLLTDPHIDTFGLNLAFRKYKELGFQPTYFGCFDYVMVKSTLEEFSQLIVDWPETKFYFVNKDYSDADKKEIFDKAIMDKPNFINVNHIYKHHGKNLSGKVATSFDNFIDGGNTGANATQVGLISGYNKILLMGCDANYIEKVDGAEEIKEGDRTRLKIVKKPETNVNYWYDDYQQVGDVYNVPQCKRWHIDEWDRLGKLYKIYFPNATVINCSPISNISAFEKEDFNTEIISHLKKYKPHMLESAYFNINGEKIKLTKLELRNRTLNKVWAYDENYSQIPRNKWQYLCKTPSHINIPTENINNYDKKFITFIMPLKARTARAMNSLETIVNNETAVYCNFIIVEDKSIDMLDLSYFPYKDLITHYTVKTNIKWTRSGLLNYGLKRTTTPLVLFWDADLFYPDNFVNELLKACNRINFDKYIFAINMFETHDIERDNNDTKYNGQPYSHVWIHSTNMLQEIRGFDEKLIGHGYEERDLHNRLAIKYNTEVVYSAYIFKKLITCHFSHGDGLRGMLRHRINKQKSINKINNGVIIANDENWGEYKKL